MTAPVILIIDDEPLMRVSLRRLLRREGYEVVLAEDGLRALAALRVQQPALIVLDMRMPEMDGAQFLTELRADRQLAAIPVVAISGNAGQLPRGVAATFAKPFEPADLLEKIAEICSRAA